MSNTQICEVCRSTSFEIIDGNFFCSKCLTQNENVQENVREARFDPTTRIRSLGRAKTQKTDKPIEGWTSWELYNFILHGLTNEAIELGAPRAIKLTVLQLWTTYLRKLEVAFTSTKKRDIPKLSRKFNKRDAEIIYGKIQKRKRRRGRKSSTSASSVISSYQSTGSGSRKTSKKSLENSLAEEYEKGSSTNDSLSIISANQSLVSLQSSFSQGSSTKTRLKFNNAARKEARRIKILSKKVSYRHRGKYRREHVSTQYKQGPQVITSTKLWAIIYLALRIHDVNIHVADMLRYSREGHLSYYKLDHLMPPEVSLTKKDLGILSPMNELTHKGLREAVAGLTNLLDVDFDEPNFLSLIEQYCQELQLPRGILLYAERLLAMCPPKMFFYEKQTCIPNYEGRAMAFIVVVMKILFGLDGITEYEISRVAEKINGQASEREILLSRLFSFCEWQRFIECRRTILSEVHFPTKIRYDPESPENVHLFLRFLGLMQSKKEGDQINVENHIKSLPELLRKGFQSCFDNLNENLPPIKEITIFPPSLTPYYSYIQHLLDDPFNDLPDIMRINFYDSKIGYTTKPELLQELATQCDIKLKIVDASLHFLGKNVPELDVAVVSSKEIWNEMVFIEEPDNNTKQSMKSENLFDYVHRKAESKVSVNVTKKRFYNNIKSATSEESKLAYSDQVNFYATKKNGKLIVGVDSNTEDEDLAASVSKVNLTSNDAISKDELFKDDNISLSKHEKKAACNSKPILNKRRYAERNLKRNVKGQFVKSEEKCTEEVKKEETDSSTEADEVLNLEQESLVEKSLLEKPDDCQDPDISILKDFNETRSAKVADRCVIFRPFKDYWMYNCIFSSVKLNNFELFEKELPASFRWLLHECADTIEMSTLDLYKEICLVEAYCVHVMTPHLENQEQKSKRINRKHLNYILKKW